MVVFFADSENQLNQEERYFAEEDAIMDKREEPRNTGPSTKRTRTDDNQDEVSWHSNNTMIICFDCPYFASPNYFMNKLTFKSMIISI